MYRLMERISDKDIEWLLKSNQDFGYKPDLKEEKAQKLSLKRKLIRAGLWVLVFVSGLPSAVGRTSS